MRRHNEHGQYLVGITLFIIFSSGFLTYLIYQKQNSLTLSLFLLVVFHAVFLLIVHHKKRKLLYSQLEVLKSEHEKLLLDNDIIRKQAHEQKKILEEVNQENNKLNERVKEFNTVQSEMKEFVDIQIKTNEQLMIAESKLKNLQEKEHKGETILNQTVEKLKDTQSQLIHNEKMASLGQLTAGIAHEINNPINFVYNGIDNLKLNLTELLSLIDKYTELETSENPQKLIAEIQQLKQEIEYQDLIIDIEDLTSGIKEGAVRTIEIVKGLRVFSRLDEEEIKEANINECLDATTILLKNKTKDKIKLVKTLNRELPDILCYPGQLNQVFMNIMNNAIQAFPEEQTDAELSVITEKLEDDILIRIKDNGMGMSKETQQKIFEPFFTTKPVGVGTGLGLSISYGIIQKHKGIIEVASELGKGTEFRIRIPQKMLIEEPLPA